MIKLTSNKFSTSIVSVVIPHPSLYSRGEWFAYTISKVLRSDLIVIKPLQIRPLISFIIYNLLAFFSILLKRKRYGIALVFNFIVFPAIYFLKKIKFINLLVYDDADFISIFSGNVTKKVTYILEDFTISRSDIVISASEILATLRRRRNPLIFVVENGVSHRLCKANHDHLTNCNFIYIGNIDFNYVHLDIIVKAFKNSKILRNSTLYIVGKGKDVTRLIEMIKDSNNIVLSFHYDLEQLSRTLKNAFFGLAPYKLKGSALFGVPLKIKEYMASGLCVIVTNIEPIVNFIKKLDGCLLVIDNPTDEEYVRKILEDAYMLCRMGAFDFAKQARLSSLKICRQYVWSKLTIKYIKSIKNAISKLKNNTIDQNGK